MPHYWVIAPYALENPETFEKVWQFDLANSLISIGWSQAGDVSKMSRDELSRTVAATWPEVRPGTRGLYCNMLWSFYHEIVPGDIVLARRGRKVLAGVGRVTQSAVYAPGRDAAIDHANFLGVEWQGQPRDKAFPDMVFPMYTLKGISDVEYRSFVDDRIAVAALPEPTEEVDQYAFVLEKYLEDFIVTNFSGIFKGRLKIYKEAEADGQQYSTDIGFIDILAIEESSASFVVIELKKGQPSDQVVGQILRYMGWVKENLCKDGQGVKGLVICRDPDQKLSYALSMTNNIELRYYKVAFTLS
jgi:restriction system protein